MIIYQWHKGKIEALFCLSCEFRESLIPAPCADKRIGDPVEGASLSDCRKICEGDKDCAFHTHVAAKEGKRC